MTSRGRQTASWLVRVGIATATLATIGVLAEPNRTITADTHVSRAR